MYFNICEGGTKNGGASGKTAVWKERKSHEREEAAQFSTVVPPCTWDEKEIVVARLDIRSSEVSSTFQKV